MTKSRLNLRNVVKIGVACLVGITVFSGCEKEEDPNGKPSVVMNLTATAGNGQVSLPLYALMPFYNQLIIHIDPFKTEKDFKQVYSFTIDEMAYLIGSQKIIALLRHNYNTYPPFYKKLFQEHIPLNNRFEKIFRQQTDDYYNANLEIVKSKFHKSKSKALFNKLKNKHGLINPAEFVFEVIARRIVKLECIGLGNEALSLLENNDIDTVDKQIHKLNRAIAVPIIDALGGWDNLEFKHLEMIKNSFGDTDDNQIILPKDLLFWINSKLNYSFPQEGNGFDFYNQIVKIDEVSENHKILLAIQDEFSNSSFENVEKLMEETKRIITSINNRINKIEKTNSYLSKWIESPLKFGFNCLSPIAFGLAANTYLKEDSSSQTLLFSGMGVTSVLAAKKIEKLNRFLLKLIYNKRSAPVLIWDKKV